MTEVIEKANQLITLNLYGYGDRSDSIQAVENYLTNLREENHRLASDLKKARVDVGAAFAEQFDDEDSTASFDIDEANDLLNSIGADPIRFTYATTITITLEIQGIEAKDSDEAERKALEHLKVNLNTDELGDCAEINNEEYECSNTEKESY